MANDLLIVACRRCGARPKTKQQRRDFEYYAPFCGYPCQEKFKLEEAAAYAARLPK